MMECRRPAAGGNTAALFMLQLAAVACVLLAAAGPARADDKAKPDIVLILIDTLRAEQLSCYGNPAPTSPTIDSIADHGCRFTEAVAAAPWTCPSVASIFTSLFPCQHKVLDHAGRYRSRYVKAVTDVLDSDVTTLAEGLSAAGYDTAGFVANRWMTPEFGFAQGFTHFDQVEAKQQTATAAQVNEHVLEYLKQRKSDKPLFLYIHYMDVHGPYNAQGPYRDMFVEPLRTQDPSEFTPLPKSAFRLAQGSIDIDSKLKPYKEYWLARYDAGIRYCDDQIGKLREQLKTLSAWDDAVVVVVADHGEQFGEHGGGGHGASLHSHQLNVPLIIRLPGQTTPETIDATVSLISLAPTLWDIAGAAIPVGVQGTSLLPLLRTPDEKYAQFAFGEGVKRNPNSVSVQRLHRKIILDLRTNKRSYYDLRTDPFEQKPTDTPMDAVAATLEQELQAWVTSTRGTAAAATHDAPKAEIDPDTERMLRSLGYFSDDKDDDDSGSDSDE